MSRNHVLGLRPFPFSVTLREERVSRNSEKHTYNNTEWVTLREERVSRN